MKTVKEALIEAGRHLRARWEAHSELTDGAARAGVAVAETVNALDCDPMLRAKIVEAIMQRSHIRMSTLAGVVQFWKEMIESQTD